MYQEKRQFRHLKSDNENDKSDIKYASDYTPRHYKTETPDIDIDEELNTCSTYDCTGLIPSAIKNDNEIESYESIYHYLPPDFN